MEARITDAQHRIEELYHDTQGKCYVSFSGGKDSTVLLALIKSCQELGTVGDIPAVFCNTGIELGVTVDFVKWVNQNYYPIEQIRPEKSFDWVLKNEGKPIKSKLKSENLSRWQRTHTERLLLLLLGRSGNGNLYRKSRLGDKDLHMISPDFNITTSSKCCDYLKKKPFRAYERERERTGKTIGIRTSEGGIRESKAEQRVKNGGKLCEVVTHGVINKMPIIDWADEDIEQYIALHNVPLSKAYTVYGFRRTGCMCCPYSLRLADDLKYLFDHEPNRYKAAMHWLKDVYIAQNVILPFDAEYEHERETMWRDVYEPMRQEMLRKYRPESRLIKDTEQCKFIF